LVSLVVGVLLAAGCAYQPLHAVRSRLPEFLAQLVVVSGAMVPAPAREDLADYFVLQGDNLGPMLEQWLGCIRGGGRVLDLGDEADAGFGRFIDGGFVWVTGWRTFSTDSPVDARLLSIPIGVDKDRLWVLGVEGIVVNGDDCQVAAARGVNRPGFDGDWFHCC
jgi:hypothetical protein